MLPSLNSLALVGALLATLSLAAPSPANEELVQELSRRQASELVRQRLTRGASCDVEGNKDDLGCCAFPEGPWSVVLEEGTLPRGACFQPGSVLQYYWKVVKQIGANHNKDSFFASRQISPTSATIRPGVGYYNPYFAPSFRPNFFADTDSPKQAECANWGGIVFTISKDIDPGNFYPNNNVSWYYTLNTVSGYAERNQLADWLLPNDILQPFEGFVISDEAGCNLYRERLAAYRKATGQPN